MKTHIAKAFHGKKILILGYGREGQSTLKLLSKIMPLADITVADKNENLLLNDSLINELRIKVRYGEHYLNHLNDYDILIKTPGIKLDPRVTEFDPTKVTSQTDLFMAAYKNQIIGITGTKGKSTTSSLIHHIIKSNNEHVVLGGNIGTPLFQLIDQIKPETHIVCELSSHQLEYVNHAPRISVLLNIFQEHLDHYISFQHYQQAKFNIALKQSASDYFIYPATDSLIQDLIQENEIQGKKLPVYKGTYEGDGIGMDGKRYILRYNNRTEQILPIGFSTPLIGIHNQTNSIIAGSVAALLGIKEEIIKEAIATFVPLEHRLEPVGVINGVNCYNDSISTIPEAAIAAIESLKPVDTVIIGGFDRGIDYSSLIAYFTKGTVKNIVFTGPAGKRIFTQLNESSTETAIHYIDSFNHAVFEAIRLTPAGGLCLLSPAASSFNEFIDFVERGKRFKELVLSQQKSRPE